MGKKIGGIILGVVGVLLILTSFALCFASAGSRTVVSGFGVALGLSLLPTPTVLSIGIGMGGAGLLSSCGGATLFMAGRQKDLSKDLYDVKEEALNVSIASL